MSRFLLEADDDGDWCGGGGLGLPDRLRAHCGHLRPARLHPGQPLPQTSPRLPHLHPRHRGAGDLACLCRSVACLFLLFEALRSCRPYLKAQTDSALHELGRLMHSSIHLLLDNSSGGNSRHSKSWNYVVTFLLCRTCSDV